MEKPVYKRVVLKLSGEALMGKRTFGIDPEVVNLIAGEIKDVVALGIQLGVVIGGGNIFRGLEANNDRGIDRTVADYMGMLATVINSLALQSALEFVGVVTRVQSAIEIKEVAEPYIQRSFEALIEALKRHYAKFTPEFAEKESGVKADVIIKATKVDGVYDKDPVKYRDARMYDKISYTDVLTKNLKVMDATAISLCRENHLPIVVFNLLKSGNIKGVICGHSIGTAVGGEP